MKTAHILKSISAARRNPRNSLSGSRWARAAVKQYAQTGLAGGLNQGMLASMKSSTAGYELEVRDCLKGMKEMSAESVDIVVTSPPYNLGIKYQTYEDDGSRDKYLEWCCEWATEIKRVLKAQGSFFLNVGAAPSNPFFPHELLLALREPAVGFSLQNTFHWIKSISVETKAGAQFSVGHFKPINSKRYVNDCHEYIFHITKSGRQPCTLMQFTASWTGNVAGWGRSLERLRMVG